MTAFHGVIDQGKLQAGQWLAVYGCGGVGLSAIMIGAALGAQVIAVDIDTTKLELARHLGASTTVHSHNDDPVQSIKDVTKGGAHVSVDALGSKVTSQQSIRSLRKRGRHVQIGLTLADDALVDIPMYAVIAKELTILGSHGMQAHRYPDMLEMIAQGKLKPKALIGKTVSLEDAGNELTGMGKFSQHGVTIINQF
jgi:alcohol dehydrogenase